jgi:hypothetical protein
VQSVDRVASRNIVLVKRNSQTKPSYMGKMSPSQHVTPKHYCPQEDIPGIRDQMSTESQVRRSNQEGR